jgi:hypothetical protein
MYMNWLDSIQFIDSSEIMDFTPKELFADLFRRKDNEPLHNVFKLLFQGFTSGYRMYLTKFIMFPQSCFSIATAMMTTKFPLLNEVLEPADWEDTEKLEVYKDSSQIYLHYNCTNLLDYAKVYAKQNVLLLADSIKYFVLFCEKNLKLSPLHYPSLSSFAFDAAFSYAGAKFEYIKDDAIIQWIKPNIRAGLSFSNVLYASAQCERLKCIGPDPSKRSHIIELDINSAYPYTASLSLCEGDYCWLDEDDCEKLNIDGIPDEGEYGYIFECNLYYPQEIHDEMSQLPLGVSKRIIDPSELSEQQRCRLAESYSAKASSVRIPKVVLDLKRKYNYLLLHSSLKYYKSKGVIIEKILRGLRFKTSPYLKPALEYFSNLRSEALKNGNDLLAKLLKRILCAVFGKFLSDTSDYSDMQICTSRTDCMYLTSKHTFKDITPLSDDVSLIHMNRTTEYHAYNIINAFIILEKCKDLVYKKFDFLKNHFDGKIRLL